MSCFHPMKAIDWGKQSGSQKHNIEVVKYNDIDPNCKGVTMYRGRPVKVIEIPCGKCIGCRLEYSRQWANRCMAETKTTHDNYFVTLTYDEEHLPRNYWVDTETGEVTENELHSLVRKDMQDFLKRLRTEWARKYSANNIRVFYCGEYGDKRGRPHYHAIIFNLPIFDLKQVRRSQSGHPLWISEEIEKIWGKGITAIGEVNWETVAYTARYVMKKVKGPDAKKYYEDLGIIPEFTGMSLKPGIGAEYYKQHKDEIYKYDELLVKNKDGVIRAKPSRYYDKLYDLEEPEILAKIKDKRAEYNSMKIKEILAKTDLTRREYDEVCERAKENQVKALYRHHERGDY